MGVQRLFRKFMGGLFYMRINDQIMPWEERKVSQMYFLVYNLNIVNLKIFPGHGGRRT